MRGTTMMWVGGAMALWLASAPATGWAQRARTAEAVRLEAQATAQAARGSALRATAPAPWIQEDPGARAYAAAREALNARRYEEAARAFAELRRAYPQSAYVADAYYYQAFALSRAGGRSELEQARELLRAQRDRHARAGTLRDAEELMVRIEAQLARRGDAEAAAAIARQASEACGPEDQVRASALSALLMMDAASAMPIIEEVLKSRDACSAQLRRQAVFLLAQNPGAASVGLLLDLAHRNPDPDPQVRESAVWWLSQVKSEAALDALEDILRESDDPALQEKAVFALSQQGSPRALEFLRQAAERPGASRKVREQAIFWIGQSPDAGGAAYLMELYPRLDDADLKERAVFAIAQSSTEATRRWLMERVRDTSEPVATRKAALFWAGQTGGIPTGELRALFASMPDREMKEQLVFVASQRKEAGAVDFLMEVARSESDAKLRERAVFWLGQSKDPRVPEFLLSLIRR